MYSLVEIGILNAITAGAMALVVLLIGRLLRRPAVIHALWVLVLLKLVTPPIVEIPVGLRLDRLASLTQASARTSTAASPQAEAHSPSVPVVSHSDSAAARPENIDEPRRLTAEAASNKTHHHGSVATATALLQRWLALAIPIVLWAWAAGTMVWFVVQGWRIAFFMRLTSSAHLASVEIQQQAEQLAVSMGARRAPSIWVLDATLSPFLWAVGSRARVIFPAQLLERVDKEARATLLTHELAHYHRGDHWVRLIEFVITGFFWWHPAVWIARREIEIAEEHCCDAWVVAQFPEQPRRYAEAILDTIDFLSEDRPCVVPVASGLGQAPFLRERIRLIMLGVAPKSMSGTTRLAVLVTATVLLPLGPELFDGAIRHADAALALSPTPSPRRTLASFNPPSAPPNEEIREAIAHEPLSPPPALADELIAPAVPEVTAWAIVNSPQGRFQAIAKTNGGLVLRDTFQQRSFDLSEYGISSIAFAPHRDLLAAGTADSTVYLFDCPSGEPVVTFAGHKAAVGSVAVSLDGRYVVSGSRDGVVKLWDIDDESEVPCRVPTQASAITCVRFSSDGRLLAVASGDWMKSDEGAVVLWDLRGGTLKQQFRSPSPVGAIAFGADELVVAQWSGQTTRWDLRSGAAETLATISKDTVSVAAFAADAQLLLLASANGEQPLGTAPAWFQRMDRDRDGQLAWSEFQGPRGTFRKFDANADETVTWDEVNTIQ